MSFLVTVAGAFLIVLGVETLLFGGALLWGRHRDRAAVRRLQGMVDLESLWQLPAREPRRTA